MLLAALAAAPTMAWAQAGPGPANGPALDAPVDNTIGLPDVRGMLPTATTRQGVTSTMQIFVIMTVLTLLRQALGTQQLPPGQVLVGLSLFLTFLVMAPTYERVRRDALQPWLDNAPGMTQAQALTIAGGHVRGFMFDQIERVHNEEEIYLFLEYSRGSAVPLGQQVTRAEVPTTALVPAFILSELKTAFIMGFRVYLPFLVIDMVISVVLISMGMLMLPPVLISLPFKLLLFVLADGWHLVVGSLLMGF